MKASLAAAVALTVGLSAAGAIAQGPTQYGSPRLFVADPDGRNVDLVTEVPNMASHGSAAWSSDGNVIIFDVTPMHRRYDLCQMFVYAVGGPFKGTSKAIGSGTVPRFSPDSSRIVFCAPHGNPEGIEPGMWVMRDDGTERKRVGDGMRPRWLKDGKSLIYLAVTLAGMTLEIINIDGTGQRQAISDTYRNFAGVDISRDGKEICFIAYPVQTYDGVLCRAPLAEDKPVGSRVIYAGRIGWTPAWSPDSKSIIFWQMDEAANRHLHVVDSEGQQAPKKLAGQDGTRFNSDAIWSPDGKRIIFSSDRETAVK